MHRELRGVEYAYRAYIVVGYEVNHASCVNVAVRTWRYAYRGVGCHDEGGIGGSAAERVDVQPCFHSVVKCDSTVLAVGVNAQVQTVRGLVTVKMRIDVQRYGCISADADSWAAGTVKMGIFATDEEGVDIPVGIQFYRRHIFSIDRATTA